MFWFRSLNVKLLLREEIFWIPCSLVGAYNKQGKIATRLLPLRAYAARSVGPQITEIRTQKPAYSVDNTSPRTRPSVVLAIRPQDEGWDFGTGAGFYVDATEPGWKDNVSERAKDLLSYPTCIVFGAPSHKTP